MKYGTFFTGVVWTLYLMTESETGRVKELPNRVSGPKQLQIDD